MDDNQRILTLLPSLSIDRLPGRDPNQLGLAHFVAAPKISTSYCCLITEELIVSVRLEEDSSQLMFGFEEGGGGTSIREEQIYPCVDWETGRMIALAWDRTTSWTQERFVPIDTVVSSDGKFVFAPNTIEAKTALANKSARVVKWDHEHCGICNACICEMHGPLGYKNDADDWTCPNCYETYVSKRSLAFLEPYLENL